MYNIRLSEVLRKERGGRGACVIRSDFCNAQVTSPIFFAITEFANRCDAGVSGWQKGGLTKEWRFTVIALQ
jgi:hypothetical protein